ncbi:MAG: N-acetylgalactosamine-6-sulfatase [Spirosoma sp.]|nr:N-acetylgalactosamine-6-sulfatase [Spirosoma sp.]
MIKIRYITLALSFILTTANTLLGQQAARKPNFVIILADDLGYGDIGTFGATDVRTPNIDRLATNGLKFTDFYSTSPVCTPTRFGLLTGRYPRRQGIDHVFFPESFTGIPSQEVTLAEALKEKGYKTGIVGKWHLGHHRQFLPLQNGFDEYFGIPYSNDMQGVVYLRGNDVETYKVDQHFTTKTYTEEAIKFIDHHKNEPFFLYLAHNMPHVPIYASPQFEGKSKRGLYGDVIEELDWSVGEVVNTLKKNGLDENTLVVFTSDNGPWLIYDLEGGSGGPLREGKGTTFEGGQRVPTVFSWPSRIKPGTVNNDLGLQLDIFPTFLKLAGEATLKPKNPPGRYAGPDASLDGEDISAVLLGTGKRKGDEFTYYSNGQIEAFRKGDWKLHLPHAAVTNSLNGQKSTADEPLLFNLKEDIGETKNLYAAHPEKVKELRNALDAFTQRIGKTPPALPQRLAADDSHIKKYQQRHALSRKQP